MNHLLRLAQMLAGHDASHRVFEPLLADWQRELQHVATPFERIRVIASGSFGFLRAIVVCAVIDGIWVPPLRASLISLAAVTAALCASVGVLLIAPLPLNLPRDLSEPMVQRWVLVWAGVIVPPAFLLATFLLRRDARSTPRHAMVAGLLAVAATTTIVVNSTEHALRQRYDTFENGERMRERALARQRAGIFVYSGARYQQDVKTTVAERRANFVRYRALMEAHRQEPPPTWARRFAQVRPVLLAAIFAMVGWTLADFGTATVVRAFGWWALVFAATITLTPIFWIAVQVPMPRTPDWMMPALIVATCIAVMMAARRQARASREAGS